MLVRSLASKFLGDLKQPELQCSMQIIVPSDLDLPSEQGRFKCAMHNGRGGGKDIAWIILVF